MGFTYSFDKPFLCHSKEVEGIQIEHNYQFYYDKLFQRLQSESKLKNTAKKKIKIKAFVGTNLAFLYKN